jgi:hypothetical protein
MVDSGIDTQDAGNPVVLCYYYVANLTVVVWQAQKCVKAHVRRQQKNVSVHHVASLMDKEHVRVQCLGNKVALADHTRVLSVRRFLFPELTRS